MKTYFATTTPGLELFTSRELQSLGLQTEVETGGVAFKGDQRDLYRANLHLRTANRVLARLGSFFYATSYRELKEHGSRLPWDQFIIPGQPIDMHVTCHQSKINHTGHIAHSLASCLAERLGKPSPILAPGMEGSPTAQLLVIRLVQDKVIVSADSSGVLLHKRGYRQAVGKAPLRETLAAAMLMASGWDCQSPLMDPFCGSGTIPIEAALMAQNIPPGIQRKFAFMDWPGFDENLWNEVKSTWQARNGPLPIIQASDRDAGVIRMAQANAERAGVQHSIEFKRQAVSYLEPPPHPGWVVTNPPYGERVSAGKDLRDLYAQFGNVLHEQCPGWHVMAMCNSRILLGQLKVKMNISQSMENGGIKVFLAYGLV